MEQFVYALAGAFAVWVLHRLGILQTTPVTPVPPVTPGPVPTVPGLPGVPGVPGTGNPVLDLILHEILARLHLEVKSVAASVAARVLPPADAAAPPPAPRQP